jgi:hypothetical protein
MSAYRPRFDAAGKRDLRGLADRDRARARVDSGTEDTRCIACRCGSHRQCRKRTCTCTYEGTTT